MSATTTSIVLLGKVGHGKTCLVNKICGTSFESMMQSGSCTRALQIGYTPLYGIRVLDTPGFFSSDSIVEHLQEQKRALEETSNSGIYVVVKVGRANEIGDIVNRIMDFTGSDDVRLVITHADTATKEMGFDPQDLREELSRLLDIPTNNMILVGTQSTGEEIEKFIYNTLHDGVSFAVSDEQFIYASGFGVGAVKYYREIDETVAKIQAAVDACKQLQSGVSTYGQLSYGAKTAISAIRDSVDTIVRNDEHNLLQLSTDLSPKQQGILREKFKSEVERASIELNKSPRHLRFSPYWQYNTYGRLNQLEAYFVKQGTKWEVLYQRNGIMIPTEKIKNGYKYVLRRNHPSGYI